MQSRERKLFAANISTAQWTVCDEQFANHMKWTWSEKFANCMNSVSLPNLIGHLISQDRETAWALNTVESTHRHGDIKPNGPMNGKLTEVSMNFLRRRTFPVCQNGRPSSLWKIWMVWKVRYSGDGTADSADGYSVNTVHLHSSLMKFTYTVHALTQFLIKFTYTVHLRSSLVQFTYTDSWTPSHWMESIPGLQLVVQSPKHRRDDAPQAIPSTRFSVSARFLREEL